MEGIGGSLRVLSRTLSSSSSPAAGATQSSSSPSIPLSSSSIPYTSASSAFNFPPPPSQTISPSPSYHPPCPPLPSLSLLNSSALGRAFPTNNLIHSGAKITILTSSASSLASSVPSSPLSSIPSNIPADASYSTASGQGHSVSAVGEAPSLGPPSNGVVVVGAMGRAEEDVSQLLNRLLDAQVFGLKGELGRDSSVPDENIQRPTGFEEAENESGKRVDGEERYPSSVNPLDETMNFPFKESMDASSFNVQKHIVEGKEALQPDMVSKHVHGSKNIKSSKRLDWMRNRLSYYHDEEKGVVYVQFAWGSLPTQLPDEDIKMEGLPSLMEQCEGSSLRGLLFMFSVCHVILLVQEGARVDTHLLRTLRILQNAKHFLAPFVKIQVLPGLVPPPATGRNSSVRPLPRSAGHSPGRSGATGRSASTIALMSGSAPSLFPGQCTPVLLFVFLEDFTDAVGSTLHATSHHDDSIDPTGSNVSHGASTSQSIGPILTSRQTSQLKGFNPVVMLARSTNKGEGGLRKKLHSSLEAQIRFLVKKCKILAGHGDTGPGTSSGTGLRGPGSSGGSVSGTLGGSALFVLDTTRVVCLVDKGSNLKGEALEAAMGVMNDMLRGKEVADNALIDLAGNAGEDIQVVRDFLWRQVEILRGRGGVLTNSTGGSMGVGMVAAAAAAAAASAAAGAFGGSGGSLKPLGNPPELPSMVNWLSACQILVEALAAREGQSVEDAKKVLSVRVPQNFRNLRKGTSELPNLSTHGKDALGATLGSVECGLGLDMKFSAEWCKRMLPSALAVYMKALPPCYPTPLHQSHLEKALRSFKAVVRGSAVPLYTSKLKVECETIWKSGRQLCDAVSLTGNPCIHQVHDVFQGSALTVLNDITKPRSSEGKDYEQMDLQETSSDSHVKPHSSGVVFLHACACGRSRRLREDPFNYENANVAFNQFPNCENLLPSLKIADCEGNNPLGGSSWSLVRLGGAEYYQHSTGLLQTGFCRNKKFLSAWNISYVCGSLVEVNKYTPVHALQPDQQEPEPAASRPLIGTMTFLEALGQSKINVSSEVGPQASVQEKPWPVDKKNKTVEKTQANKRKQASVKAHNMVLEEKRLFAHVAAGDSYNGDMAFPPLQQRQMHQPGSSSTKAVRQAGSKEKKDVLHSGHLLEPYITDKFEQVVAKVENNFQNGEGVVMQNEERIRTVTPLTLGEGSLSNNASERPQEVKTIGIEHAVVYLGFEHECPRGHRFFLSPEEMEALCSTAVQNGESSTKSLHKSKDLGANTKISKHQHKFLQSAKIGPAVDYPPVLGQDSFLKPSTDSLASNLQDRSHCKILDDGSGEGFSLLNMNLPIYMTCPYCSKLSDQSKNKALAFARNISQLQRIFMVTPRFPLVIATCPTVQFDKSCVPETAQQKQIRSNEFSLGCSVVLPPESIVILRLPFVYFLDCNDGTRYPLNCKAYQPEKTAWLLKGSTFKIISKDGSIADV